MPENKNHSPIAGLRKLICQALDPHITNDYCLIGIPNHKNIGDNLIWAGEIAYLRRFPYDMLYSSNMDLFNERKVPQHSTILLHGGGNFGDVWREAQEFRNRVIQKCRRNKIVIFPQTVFYENKKLMETDALIFAQHPDLTICARDIISYETLQKYFNANNILLVPDMAFYLHLNRHITDKPTGKVLIMRRSDREFNQYIKTDDLIPPGIKKKGISVEVKDWPPYNLHKELERIATISDSMRNELAIRITNMPVLDRIVDSRYGLRRRDNLSRYTRMGIKFINRYDEIYSTRLHGFILSVLLNKKVCMIDNSYGKNSSFYNTWMTNFNDVHLRAATKRPASAPAV